MQNNETGRRTKSQLLRLMELDRRIRAGEYPNCLTFAVEWEVSQKTVQRDIDYLRDQHGAPIAYDRDRHGFFYTDATWFLPSVSLSEGELLALLMGAAALRGLRGSPVAAQLQTTYEKLSLLLPEAITIAPELLFTEFSVAAGPARRVAADVWKAVVRALTHRRRLAMTYRRFDSRSPRAYVVDPYHLANLQGEWYLFAGADGQAGWRQYALGRIQDAQVTPDTFTGPAGFDATRDVHGTFGRMKSGPAVTVRLRFTAAVREWVLEREWHPAQKVKSRKTGEVELSFPAKGLFEVQRWVLSWGPQVRVLAPKALADAVRDEVRAMAENLRGSA